MALGTCVRTEETEPCDGFLVKTAYGKPVQQRSKDCVRMTQRVSMGDRRCLNCELQAGRSR